VLKEEATEMATDMAALRAKEADLLDFTQKLTDKNVTLQSDLATLEARASALESEHSRLAAAKGEAETELAQAKLNAEQEGRRRREETEALARKLAEQTNTAETLARRVTDAENEVQVQKRKHAAGLRELTRELQAARRALDEKPPSATLQPSPPASRSSRTSSNTSLNRLEPVAPPAESANGVGPSRSGGGSGFGTLLTVPEPNNGSVSSFILYQLTLTYQS
jgi:chromosome segregation ATPase